MAQFIVYYRYNRPDNRGGGERRVRAADDQSAVKAFLEEFKQTSWATPFHPEWFSASAIPAVGDYARADVLAALRSLQPDELNELFAEAASAGGDDE